MNYVDGFVVAVPRANREIYADHARKAAAVFKKYGALSTVECWGDDVPEGKVTSFSMAVQRRDDEVVVFSWIAWPSKQARNDGWKAAMEDPFMKQDNEAPFDGKRMIYGGFQMIVQE